MNDPGASRFRIRIPGGGESPVGSVEELSRRVEMGEVGPETPLFDSGIGAWGRAGDAAIFQFIVEELRAEGRLPDEEHYQDPDLVLPPDPSETAPGEVEEGFEPIRHIEEEEAPAIPLAPPTVDPFEMHLPLGEPDPWPPLSPPLEAEGGGDPPREETPRDGGAMEGPGGEGEGSAPAGSTPDAELGDPASAWEEPPSAPASPPGAGAEPGPGEGPEEGDPEEGDPEVGGPRAGGPEEGGTAPGGPGDGDPGEDAPGEAGAGADDAPLEPWFEDRPYQAPAAGASGGMKPDPGETEGIEPAAPADWITHGPPAPVAKEVAPKSPPPREPSIPREETGKGEETPPGAERRRDRDGTVTPDADTLAERRTAPRGGKEGDDPWETSRPRPLFTPRTDEEEARLPTEADLLPDEEPLEIRTAWEDQVDELDPRALRLQARRRRRNIQILAALGALVVLLMGGRVLYETLRGPASPPSSAAPLLSPGGTGGVSATPPGPPPPAQGPPAWPAGLEEEAEALWDGLPVHLALRVEALRIEADLDDAPPREWLGGFYLANADDFDTVPAFWAAYASFVDALRARDQELVLGAAGDWLDQAEVEGGDRERLLAMLRSRLGEVAEAREDRYLHLRRTAEAALALHEFLVLNTQAIRYAPALGGGVSADPVLEAVTETPAVRRELEGHLDRIFGALDRTRAGGQPSTAGLRAELFGGFGYPL